MIQLPPHIPLGAAEAVRFSVDCIQAACGMAARWEGRGSIGWELKPDGSRVTEVDYAVQAYVGGQLEARFPSDVLVAEEDASLLKRTPSMFESARSCLFDLVPGVGEQQMLDWVRIGNGVPGRRHWLLDPVDSTNGLLAGGHYCLNLALIENDGVEVGVIGVPKPILPWFSEPAITSGYIYLAVHGGGAWWASVDESVPFQRLQVSEQDELDKAVRLRSLTRSHSHQTQSNTRRREKVSKAFGENAVHIQAPAPIRYPLLAAGQGDLYVHLDLSSGLGRKARRLAMKAWDHAAGALLVEEAGGRVTDLEGRPLDFGAGRVLSNNRGILASNGALHSAALELLKRIGEGGA